MNMLGKIKELLCTGIGFDPKSITPEARLVEDLEMDPIDTMELAIALEDEFSIEFPDDEFAHLKTVQDVVDFVEKQQ
ncbi:acyl carrier protein [Allobaculum sp. JKK-2023]|uniref:acyl carrier protein n=1 Tax=Allobaculum sp. JKK-2023 TaxID=3108943 RepID=UPI002B05DA02|nr:acyl carrier protein [Allobaculum sp. JKK-2023]